MNDAIYRRIIEGSPDAIILGDREGVIRLWNAGAEAIFGYGSGDLLAVPAIRKDGATISIEFTIQMLKDSEGRISGAVATIRDQTKRFQREKEQAQRLKALEARLQQ